MPMAMSPHHFPFPPHDPQVSAAFHPNSEPSSSSRSQLFHLHPSSGTQDHLEQAPDPPPNPGLVGPPPPHRSTIQDLLDVCFPDSSFPHPPPPSIPPGVIWRLLAPNGSVGFPAPPTRSIDPARSAPILSPLPRPPRAHTPFDPNVLSDRLSNLQPRPANPAHDADKAKPLLSPSASSASMSSEGNESTDSSGQNYPSDPEVEEEGQEDENDADDEEEYEDEDMEFDDGDEPIFGCLADAAAGYVLTLPCGWDPAILRRLLALEDCHIRELELVARGLHRKGRLRARRSGVPDCSFSSFWCIREILQNLNAANREIIDAAKSGRSSAPWGLAHRPDIEENWVLRFIWNALRQHEYPELAFASGRSWAEEQGLGDLAHDINGSLQHISTTFAPVAQDQWTSVQVDAAEYLFAILEHFATCPRERAGWRAVRCVRDPVQNDEAIQEWAEHIAMSPPSPPPADECVWHSLPTSTNEAEEDELDPWARNAFPPVWPVDPIMRKALETFEWSKPSMSSLALARLSFAQLLDRLASGPSLPFTSQETVADGLLAASVPCRCRCTARQQKQDKVCHRPTPFDPGDRPRRSPPGIPVADPVKRIGPITSKWGTLFPAPLEFRISDFKVEVSEPRGGGSFIPPPPIVPFLDLRRRDRIYLKRWMAQQGGNQQLQQY